MKVFQALAVLMLIGATTHGGFAANAPPEQVQADAARNSAAPKAPTLPKDVYSDSLNRLPLIKREYLDEARKKLYDSIVSDSKTLAGLQGPLGIRLYSPLAAERTNSTSLRSGPNAGLMELAILVTAREMNSQFEWTAHEPAALKAGLDQAAVDVVKFRKDVTRLGEKEATIIQLGREMFEKSKVGSDTFARASKLFGQEGLVNIVVLMGNYYGTAVLLRTFDQQLHPDWKPLLPIP